jgi:hypothetical protein
MTNAPAESWPVLFPEAADVPAQAESSVPGESTLAEEGAFAFERKTIRKHVRIHEGALDLREWLTLVPQVHSAFARTGAEKVIATLQSSTLVPGDALLDAFAVEMSDWARTSDPALELSVISV